jgi:hypothetical protein
LRELSVNRGDLEKNGDGVKFKNNKVKKQRAKKMKREFLRSDPLFFQGEKVCWK